MKQLLMVYGRNLPTRMQSTYPEASPQPTRLTVDGWKLFIEDIRAASGQLTHGGCRLFGRTKDGAVIDLFAPTALQEIEALNATA